MDSVEAMQRIESKLDRLAAEIERRDELVALVAESASTIAEEVQQQRSDRIAFASDNSKAHGHTADIIKELRTDTGRLVDALNSQSVALTASSATVDVLRETNRGLWRLIMLGSGVVVFLVLALLWLYADKNGQDASRAFDAASRATHSIVRPPEDRGTTAPSEESIPTVEPQGPRR